MESIYIFYVTSTPDLDFHRETQAEGGGRERERKYIHERLREIRARMYGRCFPEREREREMQDK